MARAVRRRRLGSGASAATRRLSVQRISMKRAGAGLLHLHAHAEADGLRLDDEVLVTILSRVAGNTADLVRCAATCRRWRRLVSTNAAFICRHAPGPLMTKSFIRFFHLNETDTTSTTAPARPLLLGEPLIGGLVQGYGHRMLDASSIIVASRDGLLAAEVRRRKCRRVLRLCVCDPGTGELDLLPWLRGHDCPGSYACALFTADDLRYFQDGTPPPRSATSYCLLLVYNRRGFTAARCFSSDAGSWGPEARVSGARVGWVRLHATHAAIVHRGVVFWPRLRLALLALPTETTTAVNGLSTSPLYDRDESMLGLLPDGSLCWVDIVRNEQMRVHIRSYRGAGNKCEDMFCLQDGSLKGRWQLRWRMDIPKDMPELSAGTVRLRWFYEKSGIIFFTGRIDHGEGSEECCYTLAISTYNYDIDDVPRNGASDEPWGDMYGYELVWEKFLCSLEERGGTQ